ncbi:MAG: beta-Ig-H3/fasciclin [Parcubacteria group bacterium LiPW_41]|nr:MAG: beta-Ig-H3/fasciclin [Parcubacteria group bacterium LiPW_41]
MNKKIILILVVALFVVLVIFLAFNGGVVPKVLVSDQLIQNNQIVIAQVDAVAPSWLVIQTETNGVPGPVIGYTKIKKGTNKNVSVKIDTEKSTPKLFAMIHEDVGEKDKFDFPNNDMPLYYKGEMISKLFVNR